MFTPEAIPKVTLCIKLSTCKAVPTALTPSKYEAMIVSAKPLKLVTKDWIIIGIICLEARI